MNRDLKTFYVSYGEHQIPIEVSYETRNQLAITVHPDMRVEARAPLGSEADRIQKTLTAKARWIWTQMDDFEKYQPLQPPRIYVNGETHLYLGRQYRLRLEKSDLEQVRLMGQFFRVETREPKNRGQVKELMLGWYQRHARELIRRRIEVYIPEVERYGATQPVIRIQWMKKRWGSCTSKGVLTFNIELVKAPIHCVDYVLMHELCHLVHPNHSVEFYRLLGILMPDWQKRKERLDQVTI